MRAIAYGNPSTTDTKPENKDKKLTKKEIEKMRAIIYGNPSTTDTKPKK